MAEHTNLGDYCNKWYERCGGKSQTSPPPYRILDKNQDRKVKENMPNINTKIKLLRHFYYILYIKDDPKNILKELQYKFVSKFYCLSPLKKIPTVPMITVNLCVLLLRESVPLLPQNDVSYILK
jgi:hypothetical protein